MEENQYKLASSRSKELILIQELEKEHLEENLTKLITIMTGKVDFRGAFNWLFALCEHQGNKLTEHDLHFIHQTLIELPRKRIHNDLQGSNAKTPSCPKKPLTHEEDRYDVAVAMMSERRPESAQWENEHLRTQVEKLEEEKKRLEKMLHQTTEHLEKIGKVIDIQSKVIYDQDQILRQISSVSGNEHIGSGKTGSVYNGTLMFQGRLPVALKKPLSPENYASFENEVEVGSKFRGSSNILQYWWKKTDQDGSPLLVMEMMDGNLKSFLQKYHKQLKLPDVKGLLIDVAKGLKELHSQNYIHRDVKTENILFKREGNLFIFKIADLGTTAMQSNHMSPNRGSPVYAAPEGQTTDKQSPKMDVYSFGIVMWEVFTGLDPHGNVQQAMNCVTNPDVKRLIEACVHDEPAKRPSMAKVISYLEQL